MGSERALVREASHALALGRHQVHVWQASLALPENARRDLWTLLNVEERAQAERYRSERDRERFAAAHGVLRLLLADYLTVAPADLRFVAGPHGKPDVVRSSGRAGSRKLRFNLAHSGERALFGFADGRALGVDLEEIDARSPRSSAEKFLPGRAAHILAHAPAERPQVFTRLWTLRRPT
jgi:4'-phosphopantetheinyl transferase